MSHSRTRSPARSAAYWILDRKQIQCLSSSRRQDMVDRLAGDGPLSVRELARAIGMKPSAIYHHLEQLLAVGLVIESGHRTVNRRQEKLYATPSPRMRLQRALAEPRFRDLITQSATALCRQAERDFATGIQQAEAVTEGPRRNLGFFRVLGAPRPDALARINQHLEAIAELLWEQPQADAPLISLAWTLAPIPRPGNEQDGP